MIRKADLKAHVIQVYSTHLVMDNFLLMSSSSGSSCHREDFFYEKDDLSIVEEMGCALHL